ncbi:MAG: type II toxin-antitoxin system Phd/YefM family antitoxin [Pseudomonadota bacterium]|nr:type II toxin-antitoxin system Phd/YefM family antitoxin [Pseudomonadota bacterium]
METMGISQFKSHALKVLDKVAKTHEAIVITKRGQPIAQIIHYQKSDINPEPGKLSDALVFEKDILAPLGEEIWDACK